MKTFDMRIVAAAFLAITLAACGGGGGGGPATAPATSTDNTTSQQQPAPAVGTPTAQQPQPQAPASQFADLVVIGNSITRMPPSPDLGWTGSWGMAASAPEKDFAHLASASLGLSLTALNFSPLEKEPMSNLWQIPSYVQYAGSRSAVVVELGDNVPVGGVPQFSYAYGMLLDALHVAKLVCVSTWWRDDAKDAAIEQGCKSHGGTYVFIGDIFPKRTDDVGRYANRDVDQHPHDASMQAIAARVTLALRN